MAPDEAAGAAVAATAAAAVAMFLGRLRTRVAPAAAPELPARPIPTPAAATGSSLTILAIRWDPKALPQLVAGPWNGLAMAILLHCFHVLPSTFAHAGGRSRAVMGRQEQHRGVE